jgi:hypothetical protein
MSLSEKELDSLKSTVRCRDSEIDLLNSFVSKDVDALITSLIIHGFKSVGKTFTVQQYLNKLGVNKTIIRCDECITKKILLQRCFYNIRKDSGKKFLNKDQRFITLGENFSSFVTALEMFIAETNYEEPHVLVLDRFEQCVESTNELFPAFCRLQEQSRIKNLIILFVISSEEPKEVLTSSIPHIYFRNYSENEALEILQQNQLCKFGVDALDNSGAGHKFWNQYTKVIVDLFFAYTGSDMNLLIDICIKSWDKFIEPVLMNTYSISEFIKVYRANSYLFENENIINNSSVREFKTLEEEKPVENGNVEDLPIHSKFILIASYLASFNETRNDLHYFSKLKAVKYKRRNPSAAVKLKKGHLSKEDIDNRLLSPNYFDLERLLAILSVIYRSNASSLNFSESDELINMYNSVEKNEERKELERSKFTLSRNIDLNSQIATLFSLGLISKSATSDILGARVRWKCNIDWPTVETLADDVEFSITEFLSNKDN